MPLVISTIDFSQNIRCFLLEVERESKLTDGKVVILLTQTLNINIGHQSFPQSKLPELTDNHLETRFLS